MLDSRGQWFETTTSHHERPAPRPFGLGAFALMWMILVDRPPFALLGGELDAIRNASDVFTWRTTAGRASLQDIGNQAGDVPAQTYDRWAQLSETRTWCVNAGLLL